MNTKIFQKIDENLRVNKRGLIRFAKSRGYQYYAEYVFESAKNMTYRKICDEIEGFGVRRPILQSVQKINKRVGASMADIGKDEKTCSKCGKRPVAPTLHRHCEGCYLENRKIADKNEEI